MRSFSVAALFILGVAAAAGEIHEQCLDDELHEQIGDSLLQLHVNVKSVDADVPGHAPAASAPPQTSAMLKSAEAVGDTERAKVAMDTADWDADAAQANVDIGATNASASFLQTGPANASLRHLRGDDAHQGLTNASAGFFQTGPANASLRQILADAAKANTDARGPCTWGEPCPQGTDSLYPGDALYPNQYLSSQNGKFILLFQTDGNLVIYTCLYAVVWASNTNGWPSAVVIMQDDGNLVMYTADGSPIWSTNTHMHGSSTAVMQNDANFVIYSSSGAVWSTNTWQYGSDFTCPTTTTTTTTTTAPPAPPPFDDNILGGFPDDNILGGDGSCSCIPCGSATPKAYNSGNCGPASDACSASSAANPGCYTNCATGCDCVTLTCY